MSRVSASGIATALAIAVLAGTAMMQWDQAAVAAPPQPAPIAAHVDETPLGQCRIRYQGLAMDRQPAAMECEHANWIAHRWGGSVMQQTGQGMIQVASYTGTNDFTGVPSTSLPRPGYCRAWVNGAAASAQPVESDCRTARRDAEARGGRVLYMPL